MTKEKINPISISTTVRNPKRLYSFLSILKEMEGKIWDKDTQTEFQIQLIAKRFYGDNNTQFLNGVPTKYHGMLSSGQELSYEDAKEIFLAKGYKDPPMRGRTSFAPLQKFGLANSINKKITISSTGNYLLKHPDKLPEVILKSLLKWQLSNPLEERSFLFKDGYNIKPFMGFLILLDRLNKSSNKPVGISWGEFVNFVPMLIDHNKIEETANNIIDIRNKNKSLPRIKREENLELFSKKIFNSFDQKHLNDYADNAIRYFLLTDLLIIRGFGDYIDFNPQQIKEIDSLLKTHNAEPRSFKNKNDYIEFLSDYHLPAFSWKEKSLLIDTIKSYHHKLNEAQISFEDINLSEKNEEELDIIIVELENKYNQFIHQKQKDAYKDINSIQSIIDELEELQDKKHKPKSVARALKLEWLTTRGLTALNDAIDIKPNYKIGEDGTPINFAASGKPDIECYYESFSAISEVTMLRDKQQYIKEGIPIVDHLANFKQAQDNEKECFCLFIAPAIQWRSLSLFQTYKNGTYGSPLFLVAITIVHFIKIMNIHLLAVKNDKGISHLQIKNLYKSINDKLSLVKVDEAVNWNAMVDESIEKWEKNL